jgi:hypothetical protein
VYTNLTDFVSTSRRRRLNVDNRGRDGLRDGRCDLRGRGSDGNTCDGGTVVASLLVHGKVVLALGSDVAADLVEAARDSRDWSRGDSGPSQGDGDGSSCDSYNGSSGGSSWGGRACQVGGTIGHVLLEYFGSLPSSHNGSVTVVTVASGSERGGGGEEESEGVE